MRKSVIMHVGVNRNKTLPDLRTHTSKVIYCCDIYRRFIEFERELRRSSGTAARREDPHEAEVGEDNEFLRGMQYRELTSEDMGLLEARDSFHDRRRSEEDAGPLQEH